MKKYSTIDLFAGAGGLSYGFLKTGYFDIKVAVEHDLNAQQTYKKNHEGAHLESDIRNVDYKKLEQQYGKFDIVIGGPPCQGFSNANRQKRGLISGNNQLVNEYIRAIEELQPTAFVMENVKTINSEKHKFFCSEINQEAVRNLGINLNNEIIVIAEATILPDKFIDFLLSCNNLNDFALTKDNFNTVNSLYRNAKSDEQLKRYIRKVESKISKLMNSWDKMHKLYWDDEYKKEFSNIKILLDNYKTYGKCFDTLKKSLHTIVEIHKAIYKMQEIRKYKINLINMYHDNKHIFIEVKTFSVIEYLTKKFYDIGYEIDSDVLNAAHFGVPQNRERFIIIGVKRENLKDKKASLPVPIINPQMGLYTIGDAIKDLVSYKPYTCVDSDPIVKTDTMIVNPLQKYLNDYHLIHNHIITDTKETALKRFKELKPGQNFHNLDESLKTTYSDPTRTQNTIYQRLNYNAPSGTVLNVRKSMWIHPELDRAISIREAARLQSFPDSFIFCGSKDSQYQQIGNAVPPLLGQAIGEKVLELLGEKPVNELKDMIKKAD